eukprot:g13034.t1
MPNPFERNGVQGLLLDHTARMSNALRLLRCEWHDPMGAMMVRRGVETQRLYKGFVDVLSARSVEVVDTTQKQGKRVGADSMFSLQELTEVLEPKQIAALVGAAPAHTAPTAISTVAAPLSVGHTPHTAPGELPGEPSFASLAAYHNQVASAPGQHGVPFETSARSGTAAPHPEPATPMPPPYPPADASREGVLDFRSTNKFCFRRAFSGKCPRPNCRWRHDTVPAGFYAAISKERAAAKERSGDRSRHVVASLSEAAYEYVTELGLVEAGASGTFKGDADEELPSYHDIAWEDDSTLEWSVRLMEDKLHVDGFTSRAVEAAPIGPRPQDRQLVMIIPSDRIPWGEEEDKAFRLLRESLASPLVLAFPDMNSTFELHTDASTAGAGATLMQQLGGPKGPQLDGVPLTDLEPFTSDDDDVVMSTDPPDAAMISALRDLPFASCNALESQPAGFRRSGRSRTPSVRLRAPGEPPVPLPDLHEMSESRPCPVTEVNPDVAVPLPTPTPVIYPDDDDVQQAIGVARKLLDLCLTFGVPKCISCDGGKEFTAEVVTHLCRWLQADMRFGPADHPRGQGETDNAISLENFVEQRRQNMLEVRRALERRDEIRMAAREKANASIARPSAGVSAERGSLVLVRTPASLRHRDRRGMKLQHDVYTGPWTVTEVLEKGLSVQVEMKGLRPHSRRVSAADLKPFHVRPAHLRHRNIGDEFAQYAWGPDFRLPESSELVPAYLTLTDCRQVAQKGKLQWEFKGVSPSGKESEWVSEKEMLGTFTPLQLDGFVALWQLYHPDAPALKSPSPPNALSRSEALRMFPIGFVVWKCFNDGTCLKGQVYDFKAPYWRVRYPDGNWEELTRTELQKIGRPREE